MSDTTDFIRRLRSGDHVRVMVANPLTDTIVVASGYINKHWSTGRIDLGYMGLVIRNADFTINEDIMSIRYVKKEEKL